jgi:hypothetical protein
LIICRSCDKYSKLWAPTYTIYSTNKRSSTANYIVFQSASSTTGFISPTANTGYILTSNGLGSAPTFEAPAIVSLTTGVSGTLPVANGGTGARSCCNCRSCSTNRIKINKIRCSGTAAAMVFNSIDVPTLAATNTSVTTTTAATLYIAGGPTAGTNETITNSYGLWNVGNTRLDGNLSVSGSLTLSSALSVANGGTGASSITQYQILMGNGTSPFTGITPSTSGFILTSNGVGAAPTFQAPASVNLAYLDLKQMK